MMLEVRNLKRTYRTKNGQPVHALNDVSLKFPETGLVFILGKSGSGKSTLLNIMGGLDKADDGEIIINGKSSKEFSASEMDSYRNTYLGFIFQEYNILSDFSVRENIALALQLQHKKATDEVIDNILREVDLDGFGKRKPNELSGGQRQRVAIARALVKEPKIIFGDEPTGALDSNTGKQVFETLKKLSKDKLVVIVSHDRDFAEHFGDRVIELKDGDVISDITKTTVDSEKKREGLSLIGDKIIRIDKNHPLTMDDLAIINEKINKSEGEIYLSADSHANEALCEAARIDKDGNSAEFVNTDPDSIKMGGNESFEGIKSHFSMGHAFRMGAKSLRVKPVRLVMTILLSTIAFSLFGASATLSLFKKESAVKNTLIDKNVSALTVDYTEKVAEKTVSTYLTSSRMTEIEQQTGVKFYTYNTASFALEVPTEPSDYYHLSNFIGTINLTDNLMNDFGFKKTYGEYPSKDDEVMISEYAYQSYKDLGIGTDKGETNYIAPDKVDYDKVIGLTLKGTEESSDNFGGTKAYRIVGVYDSNFPSSKAIEQLRKNPSKLTSSDKNYSFFFGMKTEANMHNILIKAKSSTSSQAEGSLVNENAFYGTGYSISNDYDVNYYPNHSKTVYFDKTQTVLSDNEALANVSAINAIGSDFVGPSNEKYDFSFSGSYMSPSASADNIYTAKNLTITQLFESSNDSLKLAAIYKTCYDNYNKFASDDIDVLKAINEGAYSDIPEGKNMISDYGNMTDEQKYSIFKIYLSYRIANLYGAEQGWTEADNAYRSLYQDNLSKYKSDSFYTVVPENIAQLSTVLKLISNLTAERYFKSNYREILEKYQSDAQLATFLSQYGGKLDDEGLLHLVRDYILQYKQGSEEYVGFNKELVNSEYEYLSKISEKADLKELTKTLEGSTLVDSSADSSKNEHKSFKIVGVDFENAASTKNILSVNEKEAKDISEKRVKNNYSSGRNVQKAFVTYGGQDGKIDSEKLDKFLRLYFDKKDKFEDIASEGSTAPVGSYYLNIRDADIAMVAQIASILVVLTKAFLYVGIAMAIFAILLFYNFMSVSINNKTREIGILRAVGAKKTDVFKIFFSEAFIIGIINFICSTAVTIFISVSMNNSLMESEFFSFPVMNMNFLVFLLLFAIAIGASVISSLLPVTRIAMKKPIDAIHNR